MKGAACVLLLCACAAPGSVALAQEYPAKPIRLVVPFPPGGGNDTIARLMGQKLAPALGQQVLVDNRPGAGGTIGADLAAKAPADGYTLFLAGVASHGINPNSTPTSSASSPAGPRSSRMPGSARTSNDRDW